MPVRNYKRGMRKAMSKRKVTPISKMNPVKRRALQVGARIQKAAGGLMHRAYKNPAKPKGKTIRRPRRR